jgi:hypothetical protein
MERFMQCSGQCYDQTASRPPGFETGTCKFGLIGIYGGILRFARQEVLQDLTKDLTTRPDNQSMIRKMETDFAQKIMFKQRDEMTIQFNLTGS